MSETKQLVDRVLNKVVPEDVYEWVNDDSNKIAKAVKDWEDVQEGEYWYPNHAAVEQIDRNNYE